jgi:hypothetical protein
MTLFAQSHEIILVYEQIPVAAMVTSMMNNFCLDTIALFADRISIELPYAEILPCGLAVPRAPRASVISRRILFAGI